MTTMDPFTVDDHSLQKTRLSVMTHVYRNHDDDELDDDDDVNDASKTQLCR